MSKPQTPKLEDNKLWREASAIAEYVFGILDEFSEEEKWTFVTKLRNRAFDLTSNVAEAAGIADPRDKSYFYSCARRDLFGLKNALLMAHKAGSLELDPTILANISALTASVDDQMTAADNAIQGFLKKFDKEEESA